MVKLNIINGGLVQTPFDENLPTIEISEENYKRLVDGEIMFKNGLFIDNPTTRIIELKQLLQKYKEDVEQVELFDMERSDYETKKQYCKNIIIELRSLEAQLK